MLSIYIGLLLFTVVLQFEVLKTYYISLFGYNIQPYFLLVGCFMGNGFGKMLFG